MRSINEARVAEPALAVVEVAAADDVTAFAIQALLAGRCAIAPAERTTRVPGEPGGAAALLPGSSPDTRLVAARLAGCAWRRMTRSRCACGGSSGCRPPPSQPRSAPGARCLTMRVSGH
ncbi:DUF6207 family protein [Streptomyces sp. NPDC093568]|uniref:DUF6207 family protein n=1 Tax=Streptomyces sp. NPDC093568 TaxID=3366041 RepID=UPI003801C694